MLWGIVMVGYILGGVASMLTNQGVLRARYVHRLDTIKHHLVRCIGMYGYLYIQYVFYSHRKRLKLVKSSKIRSLAIISIW